MSTTPRRPIQPVMPFGMELAFLYRCPSCGRRAALTAPTQPAMVQCDSCGIPFPIVPVDTQKVQFIKIMLADGRAAVDSDFI